MFYDNLKAICDEKGLKVTPIVAECGGAKGSISNWKKA
jgi:predicted DNA-binding ribbon-helix-helix protein